ncbi:hypothetical protein EVAR_2945_1 [Eumeta japonica]|uniref:DUF4219 domain-containing protein n=1 Tax=Eumeta variegata TaxID=151549 RepID=A0A4C1T4G9_EUMVA|nr:hypothetical protein EVAR_2945_1 [Eumeta japonica]
MGSNNNMTLIERLTDRDNFASWKFAVKTYLEHEDLWECVSGTGEVDPKKDVKANAQASKHWVQGRRQWLGTLLLAGLPDEYKPMIMAIESSGVAITADSIKTKLLQEVKIVIQVYSL